MLHSRFGTSYSETNIIDLYDQDDDENYYSSIESVTAPSDPTIGEVEGEFYQDNYPTSASYEAEREILRAERAAERAAAAAEGAAAAAEAAAEGAQRRASAATN